MRKYKFVFLQYTISQSIGINANSVTFWNKGAQPVTLSSSLQLLPGESLTIPGYPGEMTEQSVDITFVNDRAPGALLIVIVKKYD